MGSASSKFRKHLQSGDEVQALQLYRTSAELRKALDPNCSYGDSHNHETPLHLAARHGMQTLLGIFLFSKGGNPNKTNARTETCLHKICMESNWQSVHVCKRRYECLNYLLKWRGAKLGESQLEKIDLAAQDEKQNTALHYAAASGLTQCVETLVTYGAPLFVENEDNMTPCDTAEKSGHSRIALYLESKMVFSNDDEPPEQEDNISMPPIEEYSGLRPQDLQEAKDQLLVETADMLSVPLFTAEALLRNHEWSREMLLEAWMTDPVACCEKCGVTPPSTLFSDKPEVQENLASPLPSPLHSAPMPLDTECEICADTFLIADEPVHMTCAHQFCKDCWERYLNVKIQEGDAHHITCPAYDCTMLVPVDIIEGIVSRDMARRYLQFDIKAFVDSNPDMKWCPFPGCGRAVKLPELDANRASGNRGKIPSDTSRGVDCGIGHYFCWECLEESHEPCSCGNWNSWFHKISEVRPETMNGTEVETEVAANCLWLVTNSKPCPNCKSPIQKNEGCNHMKCSKCKYDFCWVCLEQWKWHNSSTGGYFKCNRFEAVKKVEEQSAQLLNDAESKNKNMLELNRFVHYYTRFKNHENSFKLEEPLLKTAKDKMMKLAEAVTDNATAHAETKFVEDAVQQLLKARRVLKCSYVYGYYLEGPGYKKIVFEFMQTELEECTEILSQMVNRLYLRTPRRKIMEQACIVQRKRHEFIMAISKGLVPPETPPSVRKNKKKRKLSGDAVDEDLHRAIVASIQEVDPANPWIKDASGRHTNLVTLLEWPSDDSEDENPEVESEQRAKRESIGKCQRVLCNKVKARNPRTLGLHNHCSQWCMLLDKEDKKTLSQGSIDERMDLVRALEMSRLQYLRDNGLLQDLPQKSGHTRSHKSKHRPRSNSTGQEVKMTLNSGLSSIEELGIELQRFQELSSGFPKGGQEKEHEAKPAGMKPGHRHPRKPSQSSRFEEIKSTVVTRVPNKSVEDLYCLDPTVKCPVYEQRLQPSKSPTFAAAAAHSPSSLTPIVTKPTHLSSFSVADAVALQYTSSASDNVSSKSASLYGSMFGAIKDLSVSNIHSSESDKTKDFLSKDLASIFSAWDLEANEGSVVEETSSSCLTRFNNLSPGCYSPKLSNIRDGDSSLPSSGKGNSGKSSAGKSLLKTDKGKVKSERAVCDSIKDQPSIDNSMTKRYSNCSSLPSDNDLDKAADASAAAEVGSLDVSGIRDDEAEVNSNVGKEGEVSLLKMAENLLQMTADVHSRMKAVEKGIRDLEGICDLETMSKVKSSIGGLQSEQFSTSEREPSSSVRDDNVIGRDQIRECADADDVEQWFDVAEAISPNPETGTENVLKSNSSKLSQHDTINESVIPLTEGLRERSSRFAESPPSIDDHVTKSWLSEYREATTEFSRELSGIAQKSVPSSEHMDPSSSSSSSSSSIGQAIVVEDILPSDEEEEPAVISSLQPPNTSPFSDDETTASAYAAQRYYQKEKSEPAMDKLARETDEEEVEGRLSSLSLSSQRSHSSKSNEDSESLASSYCGDNTHPDHSSSASSSDTASAQLTSGQSVEKESRGGNSPQLYTRQDVSQAASATSATTSMTSFQEEMNTNQVATDERKTGNSSSNKETDEYWDSIYV